jgi:hypothetical protein
MAPSVHTADEAAEILRCTASWLKEQARLRAIPFTMLGGYRWTDAHLEEIITLREQRPSTPAARKRASGPALTAVSAPESVPQLRPRQPRRRPAA